MFSMETTPRPHRRSSRRTLPSNGWNAINRVAATSTPTPLSVTQSSESPLCRQTPKRQNPVSPASEGSRRTGEWLESMAKRRKAAQETVKRTSQSLEPSSDVTISNERTLRSMVPAIAHSDNGPAMAETRIIPNVITRSKKNPPVAHRHTGATIRQSFQVVVGSTNVAYAELDHEPLLTTSPLYRGVLRSSPGASGFADEPDNCPTTVDDVSQDEGEVYDVERVLGEKVGPGIHEFLIQWIGYDEQSWIPAEDCFCDELITAFRTVPRTKTIETAWIEQEIAIKPPTRRKGCQNQRPSKMPPPPVRRIRDLVTGRLHRLPTPVLTLNPIPGADREETPQLEEPALPRYARANTARFSARLPTPARVHTHRDQASGGIIWGRSKAMSEVQIISWMVKPASKENAEDVFGGGLQAPAGRNIKQEERELEIIREDRPKGPEELAPDTQHERAVAGKISEQENLASNGQQRDVNQQPPQDMEPPKETRKLAQDNQNFLQSNWKQRVPVHIRFDENDVPIRHIRLQTPFTRRLNNRLELSYDDVLRRARTQEKKSAGPSLLRHEFSNDMSHKHAQTLINHTRASPERAFGFSLSSNTVLLSIERDEY